MLDAEGWFDFAVRDPGPPERAAFYGQRTPLKTVTHHSMEGWYSGPGSYTTLRDERRYPTGWNGTIVRAGTLYQHYPVFTMLVHGHAANATGPGFESEGVAPAPLTEQQVATWQRMHRDLAAFTGRKPVRKPGTLPPLTGVPADELWLLEHRQVGPTACPSERYAPLWAAIANGQEDDMAADPRVDELIAAFGGIEAVRAWNKNGNSLLLGYAIEQQDQDMVEASLPALDERLRNVERQVGLR